MKYKRLAAAVLAAALWLTGCGGAAAPAAHVAECFHGVSCRLVEKTVVCALGYSLTNSLLG